MEYHRAVVVAAVVAEGKDCHRSCSAAARLVEVEIEAEELSRRVVAPGGGGGESVRRLLVAWLGREVGRCDVILV